jgi:hypothetical protein
LLSEDPAAVKYFEFDNDYEDFKPNVADNQINAHTMNGQPNVRGMTAVYWTIFPTMTTRMVQLNQTVQ